ncbi:hypothetical protein NJ959_10690 [Symplocastrum sp. BBK-W-15]|uniref:Uncharacterized protein n=1 Tax=Limnofasciculus baicalensis BBK-W-15 TaxID=2699891 RepID=A0AAE3KM78_9CYAN|nr:hypothetical protein [Limnofasciculus baicalensis BBK-W-15]
MTENSWDDVRVTSVKKELLWLGFVPQLNLLALGFVSQPNLKSKEGESMRVVCDTDTFFWRGSPTSDTP